MWARFVAKYCGWCNEDLIHELKKHRSYAMLILSLSVFFLFADQNLLAPNLQQCADDFGFNDEEKDQYLAGYISIGFFVVGGLASMSVGYLSDTAVRTKVFGYVILLGEGSCAGTYFVKEFWELLFLRCLTGIAVGGAVPLMFSMIGDLYTEEERVLVSTVITTATGAGIAIGQLFAGYVGVSMGWRAPFLFVAIPSLLCGALMYFTVREPERGAAEAGVRSARAVALRDPLKGDPDKQSLLESDEDSYGGTADMANPSSSTRGAGTVYKESLSWDKIKQLMRTPSALIGYFQGIPGCFPWGMMYAFLNDYLHVQRGMTVRDSTWVISIFGVGGILGSLFGGWLGQRLFNRSPKYQVILSGSTTILGIFPILYCINATDPGSQLELMLMMAFVGGFIININGPNIKTVMCNVVVPEVRGSAFALFNLTDDLGKGFGPYIVYIFIDDAFDGDRMAAFNAISMFWVVCGLLLLSLAFTYEADINTVNAIVREAAQRSLSEDANPRIASTVDEDGTDSPEINSPLLL